MTPYLTIKGAARAIDFYTQALGARRSLRMPGPDGASLRHAEVRIGDSIVMLSDEFPEVGSRSPQSLGGASGSLFLYVEDVDAAFDRAVRAGATAKMPPPGHGLGRPLRQDRRPVRPRMGAGHPPGGPRAAGDRPAREGGPGPDGPGPEIRLTLDRSVG